MSSFNEGSQNKKQDIEMQSSQKQLSSQRSSTSNDLDKLNNDEESDKIFKSSPHLVSKKIMECIQVENMVLNQDSVLMTKVIEDNNSIQKMVEKEEMLCRLCLDSECSKETGPLENVCNCKGSLQYIHRQCLWYQIENKINKTINFNSLRCQICCELCKTEYRIGFKVAKKLNSFTVFVGKMKDQLRPFIFFFFFAFLILIASSVLYMELGESSTASCSVLLIYFFFSFAMTSAIISILIVCYFLYTSIFIKAVIIEKIYSDQLLYQQYKQCQISKEEKKILTSSTIHPLKSVVIQDQLPNSNSVPTEAQQLNN